MGLALINMLQSLTK